jgi:hypothetical protein
MNEIEPKQVVSRAPAASEARNAAPASTASVAGGATVPESRRRPKSPLRLRLEALEPGREIAISYANMKTPFSVLIAIKRQQLGKHFVFDETEPGQFKVWVGAGTDRSHSLRKRIATAQVPVAEPTGVATPA